MRSILLELYPGKVILGPRQNGDVIRGFAGLLRYLGSQGLCDEMAAQRLARSVERHAAAFDGAMADNHRFGMGKRLLTAMVDEGFDPSDPVSIETWMASFNDRPIEERDRLLGTALVPPPARELGAGCSTVSGGCDYPRRRRSSP